MAIFAVASAVVSGLLFLDSIYVHKTQFNAHERATIKRFDRSDLRGAEQERTVVTGQIFALERQERLSGAEGIFLVQLKNRQAQIELDIAEMRRRIEERGGNGS